MNPKKQKNKLKSLTWKEAIILGFGLSLCILFGSYFIYSIITYKSPPKPLSLSDFSIEEVQYDDVSFKAKNVISLHVNSIITSQRNDLSCAIYDPYGRLANICDLDIGENLCYFEILVDDLYFLKMHHELTFCICPKYYSGINNTIWRSNLKKCICKKKIISPDEKLYNKYS